MLSTSVYDRFNSDLLHETDSGNFKEGYDNRRINLTFLFGDRATCAAGAASAEPRADGEGDHI